MYFGEVNSHNKAQGRGVHISYSGLIVIGYWYDDKYAPGKDIMFHGDLSNNYEKDRIDMDELYVS